jgi:hypothetical protein
LVSMLSKSLLSLGNSARISSSLRRSLGVAISCRYWNALIFFARCVLGVFFSDIHQKCGVSIDMSGSDARTIHRDRHKRQESLTVRLVKFCPLVWKPRSLSALHWLQYCNLLQSGKAAEKLRRKRDANGVLQINNQLG